MTHSILKAGKDGYVCDRCHATIKRGDKYHRVEAFMGPVHKYCGIHSLSAGEMETNDNKRTAYLAAERVKNFGLDDWSNQDANELSEVLGNLVGVVEEARDEIDTVREEVDEKLENMSEYNLTGGDAYEGLEEMRDQLEQYVESLEQLIDDLNERKNELDNVTDDSDETEQIWDQALDSYNELEDLEL